MNTPQDQLPQQGKGPSAIDVGGLFVQSLAVTVEVFTRREIGSRYLDRQAALAVPLIPGFGLFFPEEDLRPLVCFLGAYLFACCVVRMRSLRRRFRGEEEHSRYNGWPAILNWRVFQGLSEEKAKAVVEPLLVLCSGSLVALANAPLGAFLMVTAFGLGASHGLRRALEQRRLMDLKDSVSDQRRLAERFRQGRW